MNRKAEIFFDAITHLREDLVEEAQSYVFRRKRSGWRTFGSLAACIVLVMSLGVRAAMPRGCGAGGADSSVSGATMNTSPPPASTDASSPEDMPPDGSWKTDKPSGSTSDPAPGDEPTAPSTEPEQLRFTASVVGILEDALLAEPHNDLPVDADRVLIPLDGLEGLPEFYPGGIVDVTCGAVRLEDGEAVAEDVTALWLLEPERP